MGIAMNDTNRLPSNDNGGPSIPVEQHWLDLLVERELWGSERDRVLRALDQEPGGWRRCALAFLERDALSRSLGPIEKEPCQNAMRATHDAAMPVDVVSLAVAPWDRAGTEGVLAGRDRSTDAVERLNRNRSQFKPGSYRRAGRRPPAAWVVAAAVLLVTGFVAGTSAGRLMRPERLDGTELAGSPESGASLPALARDQWLGWHNAVNRIGIHDAKVVAMVVDPTEYGPERYCPIIESRQLADQIAEAPSPNIPPRERNEARRAGWDVRVARSLLTINVPGAGSKLVPVDSVNWRYVGQRTY
jgi:hypothetical protein